MIIYKLNGAMCFFPTLDAVTPATTSALTLQRSISTASDGDGDAATAANDYHDADQVTASLWVIKRLRYVNCGLRETPSPSCPEKYWKEQIRKKTLGINQHSGHSGG